MAGLPFLPTHLDPHGVAYVGRVTGPGPLVEVAALRPGYSYGPAWVAERVTGPATGTAAGHAHAEARPLATGDTVLVVFLGVTRDEVAVVDRLLPPG